jgi:putative cardiolipin synthase
MLNSPYLVPGARATEIFAAAVARGVHVSLLTNSLASTDVPLVYMGYRRHRQALLAAGVELYELSPSRIQREHRFTAFRSSTGSLHAKTAVVDRRRVFLGSMNLDPRSASVNTEMGVFIDSPALADEVLRLMALDRRLAALRVELDRGSGRLRWIGHDAEGRAFEQDEPGRNRPGIWLWRLLAPFAPDGLL